MAQQLVDRRDLDFVIWEQMNAESILGKGVYKEFNKKTCDMIITEARALAIKESDVCSRSSSEVEIIGT